MSKEEKRTVAGDGHTAATPAVRKGIENTGRQPGEGVGDSPQGKSETHTRAYNSDKETHKESKEEVKTQTKAPSGVKKELWAEAERIVTNFSGGMHGVSDEGKTAQVQKQYDQMIENDKKDKEWAGDGKETGVLGDV